MNFLYATTTTLEELGRRHALWNQPADQTDYQEYSEGNTKDSFKAHRKTSLRETLSETTHGFSRAHLDPCAPVCAARTRIQTRPHHPTANHRAHDA